MSGPLTELRQQVWPEEGEDRIAYDVRYLRLFGTPAGLLLSQLVFWSDKGSDADGWIYKTRDEIIEEVGLASKYEVDEARKALESGGVLETTRRPRRGWRERDGERKWVVIHPSPVLHFRVDLVALAVRLALEDDPATDVAAAEEPDPERPVLYEVPKAESEMTDEEWRASL